MSANPTTSTSATADPDRISWAAYLGLAAAAAMLAGTFHAPLFGARMILETTNNYGLLVPVLFGAALAYALARRFQPGSAYTFALPGAGIHLKSGTFTAEYVQK